MRLVDSLIFPNSFLKIMAEILKRLHSLKEDLLNTFSMMFVLGMFFFGHFAGLALTLFLIFTPLSPFVLLYLVWIYMDRKTPHRGGRKKEWLRSATINDRFRAYFPMKLVKTADLPPTKNYIFGTFPHGILCVGAHQFIGNNKEFEKLYPGITTSGHTLNSNFYIPFSREYILGAGYGSVSKEAITYALKDGQGKASVLVIGGSAEALYSNPGVHTILLHNRKGFIKLALTLGVDLVPVYIFGEVDLYHQYIFPKDSIVHKIQQGIRSVAGFTFPVVRGRGIFQNFFGVLPYKKPIHIVVGKPISVEKNENPSREEVIALHTTFIQELTNLFDKHKYNYLANPDSATLTIL